MEASNSAKLREAVKAVVDVGYPHNFQREAPHIRGYCYDITRAINKCFAALSASPRNCDTEEPIDSIVKRFKAENCDQYDNAWDDPRTQCHQNCVERIIKWMMAEEGEAAK